MLPLFLGANPAEVRHGKHKGLRTLAEEEDLARDLLGRLDAGQKARAIVDLVAPNDILTENYRVADPEEIPDGGITLAELRDGQRDGMIGLLRHYVERKAPDLAANEWRKLEQDGLDGVRFLWAGPEARGRRTLLRHSGTGVRDRIRQHAETRRTTSTR